MCSFTNFSLKKMFDFLLNSQNHRINIVKILETRPQSSKTNQKWRKFCEIHDVDKSTLLLSFQ